MRGNINIYINNRNRLTSLRQLVDWLRSAGHENITVIDNGSTYAPLLDYYSDDRDLKLLLLGENLGPYALWFPQCACLPRRAPYVYTDADIVPDPDCPADAIELMLSQVLMRNGRFKVGLGLHIDDIPDCYAEAERVRAFEARWWERPIQPTCKVPLYAGKVDTTFAVYPARSSFFYDALRTGGEYLARHAPWYVDSSNPTDEDLFVEKHADRRFVSWGIYKCFSPRVIRDFGSDEEKSANPKPTDESVPEWKRLPSHVDMSCYAPWYQDIIRNRDIVPERRPMVVEAGVRYGCSARIMAEALTETKSWKLHLIDPVPTKEARAVHGKYPRNVTFRKAKGEVAAARFMDASVDLLHIDADTDGTHPYEMALDILLAFWRRLKPSASVIVHDCTDHFPGIVRLTEELANGGQWSLEHAEPQEACKISAPALLTRKIMEPMEREITVVIPIIQDQWLPGVLECLNRQTMKPSEVLIIDNSPERVGRDIIELFPDLNVRYLPQTENIGVNASWNLGLSEAQSEIVSILNDDILVPDEFLETVWGTFNQYRSVGLVVPQTMAGKSHVKFAPGPYVIKRLPQREGWAFSVRRSATEPIPPQFFTFCGDDFLFRTIQSKGYWCVSNANIQIWHAVGISHDVQARSDLGLTSFEVEREAWQLYLSENALV